MSISASTFVIEKMDMPCDILPPMNRYTDRVYTQIVMAGIVIVIGLIVWLVKACRG